MLLICAGEGEGTEGATMQSHFDMFLRRDPGFGTLNTVPVSISLELSSMIGFDPV